MGSFLDDAKDFINDLVEWFKQRRKNMVTTMDETVVPDQPNEEDKPEGWRDPAGPEPDEDDNGEQEEDPANTQPEEEDRSGKTVNEVAQEVIAGEWGVGQDRRAALQQAGYNVREVEEEVTRIFNK